VSALVGSEALTILMESAMADLLTTDGRGQAAKTVLLASLLNAHGEAVRAACAKIVDFEDYMDGKALAEQIRALNVRVEA